MVEYFDSAEPPTTSSVPVEAGLAHAARIMWIGPPRPGLAAGACCRAHPRHLHARRVGRVAARARERRALGAAPRRRRASSTTPIRARGPGFYGAGSEPVEVTIDLAAGHTYELAVEVWPRSASSPILGARIGASPPDTGDEFERAVRAAAEADVAVVVVGSNGAVGVRGARPARPVAARATSASWSRRSSTPTPARSWWSTPARPSRCPGPQRAGAVLMTWYPGEEGADALADIIVGASEPSGRLPVTFPARVEDGPAGLGVEGDRYPGVEGRVVYGEGVFVGYRFYETARLAPLFPFGHGLSYGDIAFEDVEVDGGRRRRHGAPGQQGLPPGHRGGAGLRAGAGGAGAPARPGAGRVRQGRASTPAGRRRSRSPLGARRLPVLGRGHAWMAVRSRSLRGARRVVVP